ncbi:glycosyltransferase family 2 protein [Rhodoferax sp.]|uniref:glycosyltransferase family 2 protein n=1 Tax=Rhodoferax sp. TaxID=50421 RepID=UPI00260604D3|nr:glycosyltransferase family 2 protein [Rhodoferax sp.]MDD2923812.1 glycosyltransferase family 2 protein [Rhodoferax sp.]
MQLPASHPLGNSQDVGYTVINYNTAAQTLRCVMSLSQCTLPPAFILILDNASAEDDFGALARGLQSAAHSHICLFRSSLNLGFAAGSNFLIDQLLATPNCDFIGLLNNDAVAKPELIHLLRESLSSGTNPIGMSGGRMHKLHAPQEVDTLGISLYASLMPADRKDITDPYLGPTGGCCLMTRAFVEDVKATTGYCFDARFFCYCEDTDLVLRANLLGYRPAYVDRLVALHEGQASSGSKSNDFIAYHGLRNLIWMQYKLIPTSMLMRHLPWLVLANLLNVIRQIMAGRVDVLLAVYNDALKQLPSLRKERAKFLSNTRLHTMALAQNTSRQFYRTGYARLVITQWYAKFQRTTSPRHP